DFRQQVHGVFASPINLGVALLAAVTAHFGYGHALNADLAQRVFHRFEPRGLNDCLKFHHGYSASAPCLMLPFSLPLGLKVISLFAVLRNVQSLQFVLFRYSYAGQQIHYLEQNNCSRQRERPRDQHAHQLVAHLAQWPSRPPTAFPAPKMGFTICCANTPVRSAPIVPPAPCTPNASSASSYPNAAFTLVTMPKHTTPATAPMTSAGIGPTNPAAGVMATSPATAPQIAP